MNLDKLIQDMRDRKLISIEKVDAQAELDRISAEAIKNMNFIAVLMSPSHVVPVFDGQYVQHQDRPAIGLPKNRYLYPQRIWQEIN